MKIYVIGSLRRTAVETLAEQLRDAGHEVFTEYRAAGPNADDEARDYFKRHGFGYKAYLQSAFVKHVVDFDRTWLDWADVVIAANAPGSSSAYELQYSGNNGKRPIIYLFEEPERFDAMALLVPGLEVYDTDDDLVAILSA